MRALERDDRLPLLAILRYAAAVAVIWTHLAVNLAPTVGTHPGDMFRFGSAFFTQCTIFLCLLKRFKTTQADTRKYARVRFTRLYIPFLGWSLIYIAMKYLLTYTTDIDSHPVDLTLDTIYNGGEHHLWFLPFAMILGIVVYHLGGYIRTEKLSQIAWVLLLLGVGILPLSVAQGRNDPEWMYLFVMSWNRMPSVLFGAALACWYRTNGDRVFGAPATAVIGMVGFATTIVSLAMFGANAALENLAGLSLMVVALSGLNVWVSPKAHFLGRLTFGVYLCHMLFVGAFRTLFRHFGITDTQTEFVALAVLPTAVASTIFAWLLINTRFTRWLAPV